MKQNLHKRLFAISMISLVVLAACGTIEATDDSQHVTELASKIADFDVPAGDSPEFTAEIFGYTLAAYKGATGPSHLFLIQSDKQAEGSELEKALKDLAPGSSDLTHV